MFFGGWLFFGLLFIGAMFLARMLFGRHGWMRHHPLPHDGIHRHRHHGHVYGWPGVETPLQALQRRYARGEITRQQYHQMRRDLETPPPQP